MRFIKHLFFIILVLIQLKTIGQNHQIWETKNEVFQMGWDSSGLSELHILRDTFPLNYIAPSKSLGNVDIQFLLAGKWFNWHLDADKDKQFVIDKNTIVFNHQFNGLSVELAFIVSENALRYEIRIKNHNKNNVLLGSLGIPIVYNGLEGEDPTTIFERRVLKHSFVSGNGSFLFFERPTGVGPYLLMTPCENTSLEYYKVDSLGPDSSVYKVYTLSKCLADSNVSTWRQPLTDQVLQSDQEIVYSFKFQKATNYADIKVILHKDSLPVIDILPGMTIPSNLEANISIVSLLPMEEILSEYPSATNIQFIKTLKNGKSLYKVKFHHLGENKLTLLYGKGRKTYLEFFVTEPLGTLYKKRADFLTNTEQVKDSLKWYNGLFANWNMQKQELATPDNPLNLINGVSYAIASDDPALCKAPFLALKNVSYPNTKEIAALEYYIAHFVWNGLQKTDTAGLHPYGIYGTPNWYTNKYIEQRRKYTNKNLDKDHVWRSYDYPHIMALYFYLAQIAEKYPSLVHYADSTEYLKRAKETAKAYFKYPYDILPWYDTYKWGCYNELEIVPLMEKLRQVGWQKDADTLQREWEKKVKYFIYDDRYPYRSEYSIDATAFESSHAFAKYALSYQMQPDSLLWYDKNLKKWYSHPHISDSASHRYMEEQIQANIALRGWLENAYYLKGSDYRGGNDAYMLSYMAQMGGWAVLDYALHYSQSPNTYLPLGYASYLSSFALINSGSKETNYGFWYPGKINDGASGWAFEPQRQNRTWLNMVQRRGPWVYDGEIDLGFTGALRSARTILTMEPDWGMYVYGGTLSENKNSYCIYPKDGLNQRFNSMLPALPLEITLDRDGFLSQFNAIEISKTTKKITLRLENRTNDAHQLTITIQNLPHHTYQIYQDGNRIVTKTVNETKMILVIPFKKKTTTLTIQIK
ncbi:DUF5695 domain-containing protein [Rhizosphaericola mali]|uniref:Uncharacterized protein n=1 Tax=Rhizosphaericola mali TaxID=2545455 RepID=A0A5P2G1R7_9BACT|nr:DUF5695 domain-containing protein [Rhizosphaericola mali]QES89117.1 hypothetical protein E0W69_010750 [Rhizosphaericola mali]